MAEVNPGLFPVQMPCKRPQEHNLNRSHARAEASEPVPPLRLRVHSGSGSTLFR